MSEVLLWSALVAIIHGYFELRYFNAVSAPGTQATDSQIITHHRIAPIENDRFYRIFHEAKVVGLFIWNEPGSLVLYDNLSAFQIVPLGKITKFAQNRSA